MKKVPPKSRTGKREIKPDETLNDLESPLPERTWPMWLHWQTVAVSPTLTPDQRASLKTEDGVRDNEDTAYPTRNNKTKYSREY